ncbi:unnamed protein product [Euphydryas editha]|uniref:Reverse transcriptase domain-containing protein n=1 Tax=Euphydryas editha TaxID=104508 RepID=A0AAU9UWN1_EUPED|nr:unnamed protein product [Euphydryas editha]
MSVQIQNAYTKPIQLHRGVRKGHFLSPKLLTSAMENVFKLLDWKGRDISINNKYISHSRFADDIVIVAKSLQKLQGMLSSLNEASRHVGLGINLDKTKMMLNSHVIPSSITVECITLKVVREYVYLGQIIQLGKNSFEKEADRRPVGLDSIWKATSYLLVVYTSKPENQCLQPVPPACYDLRSRNVDVHSVASP